MAATSIGRFLPPLRNLPSLPPIGMTPGGGGGGPPVFSLPAIAAGAIAAFLPTFAQGASEGWTPSDILTIVANNASGTPTYSLIGEQAAGFDIEPSGNNIKVRWARRQLVHDTGARLRLGETRTFTVRGTLGPVTSDCSVTITLDLSPYAGRLPCPVPFLETPCGRQETAPMTEAVFNSPPPGWTTSGTTQWVTTQNGATLYNYHIVGIGLINYDYNDVVVEECLLEASTINGMDYPAWSNANGLIASRPRKSTDNVTKNTGCKIINTTIDCHDDLYDIGFNGIQGSFEEITNLAIIGAQNDGSNSTGTILGTNIYMSTSGLNKRDGSGNPLSNAVAWGHSDGDQTFDMHTIHLWRGGLIFNEGYPYKEGAVVRSPAGTAALVYGNDIIVGTETSWLTGNANDKLNVGECIRYAGAVQTAVVVEIIDDTHVRIGNGAADTISGRTLVVHDFDDLRTGVSAPLYGCVVNGYPQDNCTLTSGSKIVTGVGTAFTNVYRPGLWLSTGPDKENYIIDTVDSNTQLTLTTNATVSRSGVTIKAGMPDEYDTRWEDFIALGGAYTIQASGYGDQWIPVEAPIGWYNCAIADWVYGPFKDGEDDPTWASTCLTRDIVNLFTGEVYADRRPMPTARTITFDTVTSSFVLFSFADQDSSIVYEYRYRTTSGPGAWSSWTAADPDGTTVSGLSASTSYDFELRGSNLQTTSGVYLQQATVASVTQATSAPAASSIAHKASINSTNTASGAVTSIVVGTTNASGSLGSISAGDLIVAEVNVTDSGTAPGSVTLSGTGWNYVYNSYRSISDNCQVVLAWKYAGPSETPSYTASWANACRGASWALHAFSNPDPTNPIADSAILDRVLFDTIMRAPSVTATVNNSILFTAHYQYGSRSPYAAASGMTQRTNTASGGSIVPNILTATLAGLSPGATGTKDASCGAGSGSSSVSIILK